MSASKCSKKCEFDIDEIIVVNRVIIVFQNNFVVMKLCEMK